MFWTPKRLLALETRAIAIMLKAPYYTFGKHGPFQLKQYGLLSFRSRVVMNLSAMFRASRVTLSGWLSCWAGLLSSVDGRNIDNSISANLAPLCWSSPPIASRLFTAFNGFRDDFLGGSPLTLANSSSTLSLMLLTCAPMDLLSIPSSLLPE